MVILNPEVVRFGLEVWHGVESVVVDRAAAKVVEEFSDVGPYAVLADVPEQRVRVRVVRRLSGADAGSAPPAPGMAGTLAFAASPTAADGSRRRFACSAVVLSIRHEIGGGAGGGGGGAGAAGRQVVEFAALSPTGAADPVTVEAAPGGLV